MKKKTFRTIIISFTVISIKPYNERKNKITVVKNKDIDKIKKLTTTKLTLIEAKNCLEISKSWDLLLNN